METNGMKKSIFLKISTFTFLMAGVVFCGCSNSNDKPLEPVGPKTYTLTIEASKGGSAMTRALTPGDNSLVSTWETSDIVYVTKSGESLSCGSLQPNTSAETATLSGKITGTFTQGNELKFQYPREEIDYTEQDGTLESIAAKYDYSVATATVDKVSGNAISIKDFSGFTNQQAIVKFTLKDVLKDTNGGLIDATRLTISATGLQTKAGSDPGEITIIPTSATSEYYVALSGISNTKISLTATVGSDTYFYERPNVTFENGKYYEVTVNMKNERLYSEPLTFEVISEELTKITFSNQMSSIVDYSYDGGQHWYEYSSNIPDFSKGDKVSFRFHKTDNPNQEAPSYYSEDGPIFNCDNDCYVYGNIMSLVDPYNYKTATTLAEGVTFWGLFKGNTKIMSDPNKPLLLPATTLSSSCYKTMFYGCSKLERAPVLPASTLVANCYESMFTDCLNLNYIKCLATYISASECTKNWVNGVAEEGKFVKAANFTGWSTGDDDIPSGWTVTTE